MKCDKCGANVTKSMESCDECGAPLAVKTAGRKRAIAAKAPARKKKTVRASARTAARRGRNGARVAAAR